MTLRGMLTVSLGICLVLGAVAEAKEKPKLGRTAGTVLDQAGQPLAGVKVELISLLYIKFVETMTDENGRFRLEAPVGYYNLRFSKAGFDPHDFRHKSPRGGRGDPVFLSSTKLDSEEDWRLQSICVNLVPLPLRKEPKGELWRRYCAGRDKKYRDSENRILLEQISGSISALEWESGEFGLSAQSDGCDLLGRPCRICGSLGRDEMRDKLLWCLTDLYEERASGRARRGDLDGADRDIDRALALVRDSVLPQMENLSTLNEAGKAYFSECFLKSNGGPEGWTSALLACKRAVLSFERAERIFVQRPVGLLPSGDYLYLESALIRAGPALRRLGLEVINRKSSSLVSLGTLLGKMGRYEAAERIYDQAVRHCMRRSEPLSLPVPWKEDEPARKKRTEYLSTMLARAYYGRAGARAKLGKGEVCSDLEKACQGGFSKACNPPKSLCGAQ